MYGLHYLHCFILLFVIQIVAAFVLQYDAYALSNFVLHTLHFTRTQSLSKIYSETFITTCVHILFSFMFAPAMHTAGKKIRKWMLHLRSFTIKESDI